MFELGRYYRIRIGVGEDWAERLYLAKEFSGTLLKAESIEGEVILNTAAPSFQSATLDPRPVTGNIYMDGLASVGDLDLEPEHEAAR